MDSPTEVLREEHRLILAMLDTLEAAAARLGREGWPREDWWAETLAWLRDFADRSHHAKEERSLFPAMAKAGVPSEGGPIGVMLAEHVEGRALVRAMETTEPPARAAAARSYVGLLRAHIAKENDVLFPLADAVLDEPALRAVREEFEREGSVPHAEAALQRLRAALG